MSVENLSDFTFKNPRRRFEISIDITFITSKCRWKFLSTFTFRTQNVDGNFYRHLPAELKMSLEISIDITFRTQNVAGNFYRHYLQNTKCRWKFPSTFTFRTQNVAGNFHRHYLQNAKCRWKFLSTFTFRTQNVAGNFYRQYAISELKMSLEISIDNTFKTVECS